MSIFSKKFYCISLAVLCLVTEAWLLTASAAAQSNKASDRGKTGSAVEKKTEVQFEVVSIRPRKGFPGLYTFNPTPVGFTSSLTTLQMIMLAYAPGPNNAWGSIPMINAPKWLSDFYDIDARVSDENIEIWRNQSKEHELLRSAMKAVLKERCKLVIHEQPTEIPDYTLVIGKKGPKLQAATPGSALPSGVNLKSGGVMVGDTRDGRTTWRFHEATMEDLASFLTELTQERPVHDGTGLTGRYDFTFQSIENPSRDIDEWLNNWPIDQLGLGLKPGKHPGITLVIDHIEKPSEN